MKIAITGAHSTGKSTLVDALSQDTALKKRYIFRGNITRSIRESGISINEAGSESSQLLVLAKHLEHYVPENIILDRCALDGLVYTAYLFERGMVSRDILRIAEAIFENLKYDLIFYLTPEFEIVDDKVRSTDLTFRDRVAELFDEYIDSYKLNVIHLTGSIEERVTQFKSALKDHDKMLKEYRNSLFKTITEVV